MKLFTIKNNETGETKGLDLTQTLDLTYFDLIRLELDSYPNAYPEYEKDLLMTVWTMGFFKKFLMDLGELNEPLTAGRYTITSIN